MLIAQRKFKIINYITAVFVLIAFLLVVRAIISISLSGKKQVPSVLPGRNDQAQFSNNMDIMHYSPILERNPFGPPMKLRPVAVSHQQDVQVSSPSALVLVGTAVGPPNLSYAILEDKAQSPPKGHEVFALGEQVYNYGILKKIDHSAVLIENAASAFTINLEEETVSPETFDIQSSREEQSSFARQVGDQEYILDGRKVRQSLENPEKILTDARLLPNIRDGKHEGFTISEVVDGGMYHSLGLRNGDILLRINGLEISNPEVAIKAMSALQGMNSVNLDIIRNGKNMSMNYKMR